MNKNVTFPIYYCYVGWVGTTDSVTATATTTTTATSNSSGKSNTCLRTFQLHSTNIHSMADLWYNKLFSIVHHVQIQMQCITVQCSFSSRSVRFFPYLFFNYCKMKDCSWISNVLWWGKMHVFPWPLRRHPSPRKTILYNGFSCKFLQQVLNELTLYVLSLTTRCGFGLPFTKTSSRFLFTALGASITFWKHFWTMTKRMHSPRAQQNMTEWFRFYTKRHHLICDH